MNAVGSGSWQCCARDDMKTQKHRDPSGPAGYFIFSCGQGMYIPFLLFNGNSRSVHQEERMECLYLANLIHVYIFIRFFLISFHVSPALFDY